MNIYEICFSPTGGTKKVSDFLINELGQEAISIDLSNRETNFHSITLANEDIAVIAIPSYNGRVPVPATERISQVQGNGAKAIIVCVYGNRAYENTLAELQYIAQQAGFSVIAAVAAIAEHSIAHKYATNRPDKNDYEQLKEFADKIKGKLNKRDFSTPKVPGSIPCRKTANAGAVPKTAKACTQCGICVAGCPVGAINKDNPSIVNKKACISCMRCVSACPHNAKRINGLLLSIVNIMLKKSCSVRKECDLYI